MTIKITLTTQEQAFLLLCQKIGKMLLYIKLMHVAVHGNKVKKGSTLCKFISPGFVFPLKLRLSNFTTISPRKKSKSTYYLLAIL